MYHQLYPNDTPENRAAFLNDWIRVKFRKNTQPYYKMSAKTITVNFTRLECEVTQDQMIEAFSNNGFCVFKKDGNTFFYISPESSGIKEIRDSWN